LSKKELTLVIRARNAVAAGLRGAWGAISGFGARVAGVFGGVFHNLMNIYAGIKMISGAFQAVGKAMSYYAEQERASRALASSLSASGDNAAALVPKLQAVASAIQDETGAADQATLAGMARLRLLGVTTDKLGEAARATIALKAVGLEETAAQKAVAMAMQGSYDMLNRYVPALRTAKDETEKARIVNELFAKGYEQQKAVLNTTSGAWMALKGRIGDAWEEIGKAIEKSFGIKDALNKAGDAVKGFGEKVAAWIDSEKFAALQNSIQGIVNAMQSSEGRQVLAKASWDYLKSVVGYVADLLMAAGDYIGTRIHAAILDAWGKTDVANELRSSGAFLFKASKSLAGAKLSKAGRDFDKAMTDYKPALFVGPPEPPPSPPAVVAEPIEDPQENADERLAAEKEANDKLLAEKKALEDEYAAAEKDALAKRFEAQQDAAEKELALAEELAGKKIAAFIRENQEKAREEKQAARDADKEAKRAAMLEDRLRKGGSLSKKQQEWLDAFNAIAAAKGQLQPLRDQIKVAEDNLAQLQQTNRTLAEIQKGLDRNHDALNALMQLG